MDFKRHNGFELVLYPRYFVPLTLKGTLALKLNLHRGIKEAMPRVLFRLGLNIRTQYCQMLARFQQEKAS